MSQRLIDDLHRFLVQNHLKQGGLVGPDPGVRWNYRVWRFLKSALPIIAWKDDLYYLQAQGYWILANWQQSLSQGDAFASHALKASDQVLKTQRVDGAWDYPNPEWRGRVATVEGIWASLGLLESYRRTKNQAYLDAVLRWHDFFITRIGFQDIDGTLAVNYFAGEIAEPVPNNSALALRYLSALYAMTNDSSFLEKCSGLLEFIAMAQKATGEVPYVFGDPKFEHFQCFQYHAFMLLDILEYYRIADNQRAIPVLKGIGSFLEQGIAPSGDAYYQCGVHYRHVNYHTMAVGTALKLSTSIESDVVIERNHLQAIRLSENAVECVAKKQRVDGSIPHSRGDYYWFQDRRSYPRYLAMILYHATLLNS